MDTKSAFMELAEKVAQQATCPRASCGTVLVVGHDVVGVGWNGAADGEATCLAVGCTIEANHCVRTMHSEVRAIADAARNGHSTKGATAYMTQRPCQGCLSIMAESGIVKVWYSKDYHSKAHGEAYCSKDLMAKLEVEHYK